MKMLRGKNGNPIYLDEKHYSCGVHSDISVFPHQEEILHKTLDYIDNFEHSVAPKIATIIAGMGSGKTFLVAHEFTPAIVEKYQEQKKGGVILFTSPESILAKQTLEDFYGWYDKTTLTKVDLITDYKKIRQSYIDEGGIYILITTIQSVMTWTRKNSIFPVVIAAFLDELHRGLGIEGTKGKTILQRLAQYKTGKGWRTPFKGAWFESVMDLKPEIMIGLTGTKTTLMTSDSPYYVNIVESFERNLNISPWLNIMNEYQKGETPNVCENGFRTLREEIEHHWKTRSSIMWHENEIYARYPSETDEIKKLFTSYGMIDGNVSSMVKFPPYYKKAKTGTVKWKKEKCDIQKAKETYKDLVRVVNSLNPKFKFPNPFTGGTKTLYYADGVCELEIDTSAKDIKGKALKTYATKDKNDIVGNMNDPLHPSGMLFVQNKGAIGLNISNIITIVSLRDSGKSKHDPERIIFEEEKQYLARAHRVLAYLREFIQRCYETFPSNSELHRVLIRYYMEFLQINYTVPAGSLYFNKAVALVEESLPEYDELEDFALSILAELEDKTTFIPCPCPSCNFEKGHLDIDDSVDKPYSGPSDLHIS